MDIVAFIKSLVLDSFGGVSVSHLPIIIVQLILSVAISLFVGKIFEIEKKHLLKLVFSGVIIIALSIAASVSVPISIVFSTLMVLWVLKFKHFSFGDNVVFVMIQFLFGIGHVLIGIISLIILGIYYLIFKNKS